MQKFFSKRLTEWCSLTKNLVLMKSRFIKRSSGLSIIDTLFTIVIICLVYLSWEYVPLVYKSKELESIAKDYTFKSAAAREDIIRQAVVEDARRKIGVELNMDDVVVTKDGGRTKIQINWHTAIDLPFDYQIPRTFIVEYERKQLY
jgi:hypothetical protein